MPSFEVDVGLSDDACLALLPRKQLTACIGLWTLAGIWTKRARTDGLVPRGQVERLGGTQREAGLLVSCGLWLEEEHGYRFAERPKAPESDEDEARRERALSAERARRYRDKKRDGQRDGKRDASRLDRDEWRDAVRDGGVMRHVGGEGGALSSPSSLASPSVSPFPLGSESTQEAGCNAQAREEPPNPVRLRFELEELVRAEFFARSVTPQKAPASQWRDGCQTVADALQLGAYPDARAAMQAFAVALVDACAAGKPLGLALQQTPLGAKLRPPAPGGRQLSPLALATLARRAEGT